MARATCTACGTEVEWRARRGVRLADLRCRCGGTLRGGTGAPGKTRGRTFGRCAVCGKRRWDATLVALRAPAMLFAPRDGRHWTEFPAGATVCSRHQVVRGDGRFATTPDGREWLYARDVGDRVRPAPADPVASC